MVSGHLQVNLMIAGVNCTPWTLTIPSNVECYWTVHNQTCVCVFGCLNEKRHHKRSAYYPACTDTRAHTHTDPHAITSVLLLWLFLSTLNRECEPNANDNKLEVQTESKENNADRKKCLGTQNRRKRAREREMPKKATLHLSDALFSSPKQIWFYNDCIWKRIHSRLISIYVQIWARARVCVCMQKFKQAKNDKKFNL